MNMPNEFNLIENVLLMAVMCSDVFSIYSRLSLFKDFLFMYFPFESLINRCWKLDITPTPTLFPLNNLDTAILSWSITLHSAPFLNLHPYSW